MFFKVVDGQQIEYVHVIQIVVTDTGTFIKVDGDYPINDNLIPITQEEWDSLKPTVEEPEPEPYLPEPETTEQKLARIEEQNIILMDALATTFEELIVLRELVEGGTK